MRITAGMMMSDYQKTLESNLNRLNDESDKISSERKFSRGSQDPVAAMKTLRTNRQIANVSQYQQNVSEATSWMTATESSVKNVDQILQSANEMIVQAKNGTYNVSDAQNQAKSIDGYQQEIVDTLNSTFNGQYIFGGTASGPQPFKIGTAADLTGANADVDTKVTAFGSGQVVGKLLYNIPNTNTYVPVSAINNSTTGDPGTSDYKYSINNPAMKYSMPVDLGLGIKTDAATHNVVGGTAFESSTSALDFLILNPTGTSSVNIVDSLAGASQQLNSGATPLLDDTLNMVQSTQDAELKSTVVVGEKSKLLDYIGNKLIDDNTNLTSRLSSIADVDITQESTNYQMDQMVYQASLSIGSTILQHSLIDFLK
jgi:flagellar hook-associated protein 3 FlgL